MRSANLARGRFLDMDSVLVNAFDRHEVESFQRIRTQIKLLVHSQNPRTNEAVHHQAHPCYKEIIRYIKLCGTFFGVNVLGNAVLGFEEGKEKAHLVDAVLGHRRYVENRDDGILSLLNLLSQVPDLPLKSK